MDYRNGGSASVSKSDLKHCESEDLAHPEFIQSFGALLVIDAETGELVRWSDNAPSLLDFDFASDSRHLESVIPDLAKLVNQSGDETFASEAQQYLGKLRRHGLSDVTGSGFTAIECVCHTPPTQRTFRLIECIPVADPEIVESQADSTEDLDRMFRVVKLIESSQTIDELIENFARSVQTLTAYDRTMVYKFDEDWHGEVVQEVVADHLQQRFLGQHFPASDIPRNARELYKKNLLRVIADVDAEPSEITPSSEYSEKIDLSRSVLRSPSPFHLVYLRNMDVRSTLTLSIIVDGELWGMLACHDSRPRVPPHSTRNSVLFMMEMVTRFMSNQIGLLERLDRSQNKLRFLYGLDELSRRHEKIDEFLLCLMQFLREFLQADKATLIERKRIYGDLVDSRLLEFCRSHALKHREETFVSHSAGSFEPISEAASEQGIGGFVFFPIFALEGCGILLLRNTIHRSRDWAGKPGTFSLQETESGQVVLGARESFEIWREIVSDQCEPWPRDIKEYLASASVPISQVVLKNREKEANEQRRILASAVEEMPDLALITKSEPEGPGLGRQIVYANPAICKLSGYSSDELIGKPPSILQGSGTDKAELARISRALKNEQPVSATLLNYSKDGTPYHVELKIVPVKDEEGDTTHFASVQRDITEELALRHKLSAQNEQLQNLTNRLPGAVYIFQRSSDGQYEIPFASVGFSELFKLSPSDTHDFSVIKEQICRAEHEALIESIESSARNLTPWRHAFHLNTEVHGSVCIIRGYAMPYEQTDGSIQWFGTLEEITERETLALEIESRERDMAAILQTIPETVIDLDAQGEIKRVYSNRSSFLGRSLQTFDGETLSSVLPHTALIELFQSLEASGTGETEFEYGKGSQQQSFLARMSAKASRDSNLEGYVLALTDISDRIAERNQAIYNAEHDSLTGLLNRHGFEIALERICEPDALHSTMTAFFIDLDGFKAVNDIHGHKTGDSILIEVGKRLSGLTGPGSTLARIGGDEFILVTKTGDHKNFQETEATEFAESMRKMLALPYQLERVTYHINCSIGIAQSPPQPGLAKNLLGYADTAMYAAKRDGGGRVRFYEQSIREATRHRFKLEQDLKVALQAGGIGLRLAYQPVIKDEKLFGFEALARWEHPELGSVSPGEFIPLAEQSSLILRLGDWVIREAVKMLVAWSRSHETAHLTLGINVSPLQIKQDDFAEQLLDTLHLANIAPDKLKVEVTESLVHHDLERSIEKLRVLRREGIQCSLDDFGTGYSSLAYLRRLPLDEVKVDQQFVREMGRDAGAEAIVKLVFSLAKTLDLRVVAEGVETEAELIALKKLGYRCFQGYFFGKPQFEPDLRYL
ncbi:EAL domain-containing protein [Alishewanella sp. HL-SH06]|uniref:EAL domain-containing protein n=1 Tax=Alishewanella sp. HL-SH06 TaxID=3461144 RepID=UPI0040416489